MPGTSYHFASSATVDAPRAQVHELLLELERYPEWWRQVRAVASLGPDDALLVCRSLLPYDLEVHVHAVSRERDCLAVDVDGPLEGWVRWALTELGPRRTRLDYQQQVRVRAWPLVAGSWVARPLLRANHGWMMRGAEQGIRHRLGAGQDVPGPLSGGA